MFAMFALTWANSRPSDKQFLSCSFTKKVNIRMDIQRVLNLEVFVQTGSLLHIVVFSEV